jgi:hypothetical protein
VEGGRDNNSADATYGDLIGFINPPGGSGVLGAGTSHGSNPAHDTQLGTTRIIPCDDISDIDVTVDEYNHDNPVTYAFLPTGKTTYNSNSFTYTPQGDIGLQGAFGPFPTTLAGALAHGCVLFYPGWGVSVPGLD